MPIAVPLPPDNELTNSIRVIVEDQGATPFFVASFGQTRPQIPTRTALFLIDTSGSMNKRLDTGETRFEAAKEALEEYLQGFQEGDAVAIAAFQSRHVQDGIVSAKFATSREEARRQIEDLPAPEARNNTALYSAFDLGLEKLMSVPRNNPESSDLQLYVLTDGENDVGNPGDDPGLLAGDDGRKTLESKVRAYSHIQVNAIGFGDPREVDEAALKEITNRYHMFTGAADLKRFFKPPEPALPISKGLQVTFKSPWSDRAWLAARTLHVRVSMQLPGGATLASDDITWSAPSIGQPLYEGKCETVEENALLNGGSAIAPAGWTPILRPVGVFALLAVAILLLWFWVPRLVWPEAYGGGFQPPQVARWTPATRAIPQAVPVAKRPAPPGFQQDREAAGSPQRAPADATRVIPVNRMGTRTRLELRRAAKDDS
ncbi:MAG: vWA domain-containing protein [Terriglobia bacterium]